MSASPAGQTTGPSPHYFRFHAPHTHLSSVFGDNFWSDPLVALGELRRTLRDGGRLVLSFNPRATAQKLPYTRHGFTLYDGHEVQHLLEHAGFRDVRLVTGSQKIGEFICAVGTK